MLNRGCVERSFGRSLNILRWQEKWKLRIYFISFNWLLIWKFLVYQSCHLKLISRVTIGVPQILFLKLRILLQKNYWKSFLATFYPLRLWTIDFVLLQYVANSLSGQFSVWSFHLIASPSKHFLLPHPPSIAISLWRRSLAGKIFKFPGVYWITG